MKEKIKDFILHFFIIYVIFIVVVSLIKLINYPTKIELHDSEKNIAKYEEYKNEADQILKDNKCHNTIRDVIKYYKETSYDGEVDLNKFDFTESSTLTYALELVNNCEEYKTKFEEKNVFGKMVAGSVTNEELYYKPYLFKYEISIDDLFGRENFESDIASTKYDVEKKSELELISELLEVVKEGEINEE